MQESLPSEHSRELLRDTLEQLLYGSGVSNKCGGHLQTPRWDVAHGRLYIVRDPFHEVAAVLILNVEHLLVYLLHRHPSSEDGSDGEVTSVSRIASCHHVLSVEHLLGEFGDGESPVLLAAPGGQGSESGHEEVKTGEWYHVDSQFP